MKSRLFSCFSAGFVGLSIASVPAGASDCDPFWSTIGIDSIDGRIDSFIRFDDGSGSALYIGGYFTMINGQSFKGVARWDGSTLSPVGDGFENTSEAAIVADFEVYDDGTGPALYASGLFKQSGAESLGNLARWDGSSWVDVGGGTTVGVVWDMDVFDDGRGPALYIGGTFPSAGGVSDTSRLAR